MVDIDIDYDKREYTSGDTVSSIIGDLPVLCFTNFHIYYFKNTRSSLTSTCFLFTISSTKYLRKSHFQVSLKISVNVLRSQKKIRSIFISVTGNAIVKWKKETTSGNLKSSERSSLCTQSFREVNYIHRIFVHAHLSLSLKLSADSSNEWEEIGSPSRNSHIFIPVRTPED